MELQLSWPSGYYSLFAAKHNDTFLCPEGDGFQWKQGSITVQHHIFFPYTLIDDKLKIGIKKVSHQVLINFVIKYRELKCIF